MTITTAGLVLTVFGLALSVAHAADPTGTWLDADNDAIVRIADCANLSGPPAQPGTPRASSGALCGVVVWLKEPIDPSTGRPRVDSRNVDPAKKNQPILGMQGIFDMRPSTQPGQWEGRVYNVDDGKIYSGNIIMKNDNELYVQGCFMMFCRGEQWIRRDIPSELKPDKPPQARAR